MRNVRKNVKRKDIVIYPHPTLSAKAKPIAQVSQEMIQIGEDMLDLIHRIPALGLAANQIDLLLRIIAVNVVEKENQELPLSFSGVMINPEIIEHSEMMEDDEEACLSAPSVSGGPIPRYKKF